MLTTCSRNNTLDLRHRSAEHNLHWQTKAVFLGPLFCHCRLAASRRQAYLFTILCCYRIGSPDNNVWLLLFCLLPAWARLSFSQPRLRHCPDHKVGETDESNTFRGVMMFRVI